MHNPYLKSFVVFGLTCVACRRKLAKFDGFKKHDKCFSLDQNTSKLMFFPALKLFKKLIYSGSTTRRAWPSLLKTPFLKFKWVSGCGIYSLWCSLLTLYDLFKKRLDLLSLTFIAYRRNWEYHL